MGESGNYVLEMKDIVKIFPGVRALDGVTLRVRPGSVHVIVGENGAGKSTLMKIISGEYVADGGEMIYKGSPVGKRTIMETINMGISMIAQELNPVGIMTVAENIFLGREPRPARWFWKSRISANGANTMTSASSSTGVRSWALRAWWAPGAAR